MVDADAGIARMAFDLVEERRRALSPSGRIGLVRRYLKGNHDLPYMPRGAKAEYRRLAENAITNWLPLISDTFTKMLFVDGYRPARAPGNARPWEYWQANGLDSRQSVVHRGALEYGAAYVLVLPSDGPAPLIRPLPPTRTYVLYEDYDDEWPTYALVFKGTRLDGTELYDLYEGDNVHAVEIATGMDRTELTRDTGLESGIREGTVRVVGSFSHGLGRVPLVRFRERMDGESEGIIRPAIRIQNRINEAVFSLSIAIQYASFRQRWATGLAIPVDEEEMRPDGSPNPNHGRPIEPFEAAVDRLWVTDSPDAKFGEFSQTDVSGHLNTYTATVRTLAAISQVSPLVLLGDLVNLSADALASIQDTTTRKASEYETNFGESWEQVLRLAALADGDVESAQDTSAQVRWRDSEARSLASTVDALGKMASMLMVPVEELWERIPGVTDQDVERWREAAGRADGLRALAEALTSQREPAVPEVPGQPAELVEEA